MAGKTKRPAHTPGPWLVERIDSGPDYVVWTRQPHTGELAHVMARDINGRFPAEANARIMSTAPELLEAAKLGLAFIDRVEGHGYGGEAEHIIAQHALRAAIAKATAQ